jgi:xanthine dehydrogenase accessory factor
MTENPIVRLSEALQNKQSAVLATVIETRGASPAKVGAQVVMLSDGSTIGTAGGGKLEAAILKDAQDAVASGLPKLSHYKLTEHGDDAIGTLCGGEVHVFIQPFLPAPQLIVVGGGHIGHPLKVMGEAAGFDVTVVDVEPGRMDVPGLQAINLTTDSFIVLITTDHVSDEAALRQVIDPCPLHRYDWQPSRVGPSGSSAWIGLARTRWRTSTPDWVDQGTNTGEVRLVPQKSSRAAAAKQQLD